MRKLFIATILMLTSLNSHAQSSNYDVNGDGSVTSADVTAIYDIILGTPSSQSFNADVNNDGNITSADITAVYNILLGTN